MQMKKKITGPKIQMKKKSGQTGTAASALNQVKARFAELKKVRAEIADAKKLYTNTTS